jgi:hypothetical protein
MISPFQTTEACNMNAMFHESNEFVISRHGGRTNQVTASCEHKGSLKSNSTDLHQPIKDLESFEGTMTVICTSYFGGIVISKPSAVCGDPVETGLINSDSLDHTSPHVMTAPGEADLGHTEILGMNLWIFLLSMGTVFVIFGVSIGCFVYHRNQSVYTYEEEEVIEVIEPPNAIALPWNKSLGDQVFFNPLNDEDDIDTETHDIDPFSMPSSGEEMK